MNRHLARDGLTIVAYHAVVESPLPVWDWCFIDRASFRNQMLYLRENFAVLPMSEAVERMRHGGIRCPTAVITFDDGYQNNHDVAFPVIRELGLPATVFLNTRFIDSPETIWFCRLNRALGDTAATLLEYGGTVFPTRDILERARTSAILQERLKGLAHPRLLQEVRRIIARLGLDPSRSVDEGSPYRILSAESIAEMAASGHIEFGAHTHSHAILSRLSVAEQEEEIAASVEKVGRLTGRRCRLFAYPNGRPQDYDEGTVDILRANGVRAAVTSVPGPNLASTSPYHLRRYGIGSHVDLPTLQAHVHHLIWAGSRLRHLWRGKGPRPEDMPRAA